MTTFGLDVSHYQPPTQLRLAGDHLSAQGYAFVMAKASEGATYADPAYGQFRDAARRAGMLFAAYHFLSHGNFAAQAAKCSGVVNDPDIPVMIDLEAYGATLADAAAFRSEMSKRGYRVTLLYLPHWYWQRIGSPSLAGWTLVSSAYPSSKHAYGSALYPGDNGSGWEAYGGVTPTIWQFASSGQVDGYAGNVDLDAYKGTRAELAAAGLFHDFAAKTMRPDPVTSKPKPPAPKPPLTRGPNVDPAIRSLRKATSRAAKAALKTLLRIRPWHKRRK